MIVSVDTVSIPHVETFDRCAVEVLGHGRFKVVHLTARFGYHDKLNIPEALAQARKQGLLERNLDLEHASYFVSRITITPTDDPGMPALAKEPVHRDGPQRFERDRSLRAAGRPHGDHGLAGRSLNVSSVASARKAAAAARGARRWTSPTVRVIFGRALRTIAPRRCASRASGAGSRAAPAPASTSGTIASRAAVWTAICGVTPTAASACSSRIRVEVPGGLTTSGVRASSRAPSGRSRSGGSSRRQHEQQLLLAERVGDELPAGQREVGGAELAGAVADERARRRRRSRVRARGPAMPGWRSRKRPISVGHRVDRERGQRGDLERAGLQLDDPGDRVARLVDRPQDLPGGTDQRLAGGGQAQTAPDAVEQLRAELALERAQGL